MIQCDSGHLNGDLIACARHRIYDLRAKADENQTTHVFVYYTSSPSSVVFFGGIPGRAMDISSH